MASFLPLISEILPMIMPASTHVMRARQLEPAHPTVEGPVVTRAAVVDKCDKMCASVLTTRPHSSSPVRHNSEQGAFNGGYMTYDAIIYAVSGTGTLVVKEGFEAALRHHELSPGDFAVIPAWTEHQIRNDADADVVWVVVQGGARPGGATLTDWGGDEVSARD